MKTIASSWIILCLMALMPLQQHAAKEHSMTLATPTGKINGTLSMPEKAKHVPVVLLIAGSGPTNRNGNNPQAMTNCFKMMADELEAQGIASLRFDKRGIPNGSSVQTPEKDLRFEHYVEDVRGWIDLLARDKRFSKVIVAGHSEGSLVGMLACEGNAKVAAFISIAGPGRPADEVLKSQIGKQMPESRGVIELAIDSIKAGHPVSTYPPALASLFRSSVQPYLTSWFKWNPSTEIQKLSIPILILQGSTDIQVETNDAELLHQAVPTATYQLISKMNHVLKACISKEMSLQMAIYMDPKLPLHPDLIPAILTFVK